MSRAAHHDDKKLVYNSKNLAVLAQIQEIFLQCKLNAGNLPPAFQLREGSGQPQYVPSNEDFQPQRWTAHIECKHFGMPMQLEELIVQICNYQRERLNRSNKLRRGVRNDPINLFFEELKYWFSHDLPTYQLSKSCRDKIHARLVYIQRISGIQLGSQNFLAILAMVEQLLIHYIGVEKQQISSTQVRLTHYVYFSLTHIRTHTHSHTHVPTTASDSPTAVPVPARLRGAQQERAVPLCPLHVLRLPRH
jgi:hypothetical protein